MVLVGKNNGFEVYFDCDRQSYSVFKDGILLRDGASRFTEVRSYLD